jgi:predicted anti-sigma-YlaC factor YlaD
MKCDEATALFLSVHDGDVSDSEKKAFFDHLDSCDNCRSEWEAYLITLNEVSGMYPLAPPDEFAKRVKQAIGRRSKGRFFGEERAFSLSFAIVSFVLIVLVMLSYLYISSDREIMLLFPGDETDSGVLEQTESETNQ